MVQCKCCGKYIFSHDLAVRRDVWVGNKQVAHYFCSEQHMHEWYIRNLNTLGM